MKIRQNFVANSSSSSFILKCGSDGITVDNINKFITVSKDEEEYDTLVYDLTKSAKSINIFELTEMLYHHGKLDQLICNNYNIYGDLEFIDDNAWGICEYCVDYTDEHLEDFYKPLLGIVGNRDTVDNIAKIVDAFIKKNVFQILNSAIRNIEPEGLDEMDRDDRIRFLRIQRKAECNIVGNLAKILKNLHPDIVNWKIIEYADDCEPELESGFWANEDNVIKLSNH